MFTRKDFKLEMIIGLGGLVISLLSTKIGLSGDVASLMGVIVVIIPLSMASLKIYIHQVIKNVIQDTIGLTAKTNVLSHKISMMAEPNISFAQEFITETIEKVEKIEKGIIPLSEANYFDRIISEARSLEENNEIYAVNSFDERRFEHDPRERIFFEENIKAIKNRNVSISRIFIYDDGELGTSDGKEKLKAIKKNEENGIKVSIVCRKQLLGKNELMLDWIMFDGDNARLYIDYQDLADETRVSYAEMYINNSDIIRFKKIFDILMEHTISEKEKLKLYSQISEQNK